MAKQIFMALSRIGAALQERRERARTRSELSQLTDRQLADIGISRSEIRAVATYGRRYSR